MQLDGSYEFLELTQHDGIVVSKARDRRSGQLIQIHRFPSSKSVEANQICEKLLRLNDEAQRKVLQYGKEGNSAYFVTEALPAGERLEKWVERQIALPTALKPLPQRPASDPRTTHQFTR